LEKGCFRSTSLAAYFTVDARHRNRVAVTNGHLWPTPPDTPPGTSVDQRHSCAEPWANGSPEPGRDRAGWGTAAWQTCSAAH